MIKRACKYFLRARKGYIYCEGARLTFGSVELRKKYCGGFCNTEDKRNACPIKKALDEFYDFQKN